MVEGGKHIASELKIGLSAGLEGGDQLSLFIFSGDGVWMKPRGEEDSIEIEGLALPQEPDPQIEVLTVTNPGVIASGFFISVPPEQGGAVAKGIEATGLFSDFFVTLDVRNTLRLSASQFLKARSTENIIRMRVHEPNLFFQSVGQGNVVGIHAGDEASSRKLRGGFE